VSCKDCNNLTCRACEAPIDSYAQAITHKCLLVRAAASDDVAFQGLKRGRDFQLCPFESCERKIELSDGCNLFARCYEGLIGLFSLASIFSFY